MEKWYGSAGLCLNENSELLMVLQGTANELQTWSVPSGGKEIEENFEECCIREIKEETGFCVEVLENLLVKKGIFEELKIQYEVHYFSVKMVGGKRTFQDPDDLIVDISWKSAEEIKVLQLTYSEDKELLVNYIQKNQLKNVAVNEKI